MERQAKFGELMEPLSSDALDESKKEIAAAARRRQRRRTIDIVLLLLLIGLGLVGFQHRERISKWTARVVTRPATQPAEVEGRAKQQR